MVFFALFAQRRFVDDYELGDASVSWFTEHFRCAFDYLRTVLLILKQLFFKLFSVKSL